MGRGQRVREEDGRKRDLIITQSLFSSLQESMTKIKECLVDNKKHIRFGSWNGSDVSSIFEREDLGYN